MEARPKPEYGRHGEALHQAHRYVMVDATGEVQYEGFFQHPAAERRAKWHGFGVYDRRAGEYVLPVDLDRRADHLEVEKSRLEGELEATSAKLAQVKRVREGEEIDASLKREDAYWRRVGGQSPVGSLGSDRQP